MPDPPLPLTPSPAALRREFQDLIVGDLLGPALDEVRREVWNAAGKQGQHAVARDLKNARYAPWKNPGDLTARQEAKLASIAETNKVLCRAYLLKEQLRQVFVLEGAAGVALLDAWLKWARRCRIPSFVKLAKAITEHRGGIEAALIHGLSNARWRA